MVQKHFLDQGGAEGVIIFHVKTFYLTVPKNSVVELFCVSKRFRVSTMFLP